MKKLVLLALLMAPLFAFSQYDFETRYFTITADALPDVEKETLVTFSQTPSFTSKPNAFKMNRYNYRIPVDMSAVVAQNTEYVTPNTNIAPVIESKSYGFSVSVRGSNSFDGLSTRGSRVKNIVYQEMRGLFVCSPYGYQPRR